MRSVPADDAHWGAEPDGMGNRQARIVGACSTCGAAVALALAGCSSPMRTQYVTLHSIAVEPAASTNDELAAAFRLDDYAEPALTVAAADTDE